MLLYRQKATNRFYAVRGVAHDDDGHRPVHVIEPIARQVPAGEMTRVVESLVFLRDFELVTQDMLIRWRLAAEALAHEDRANV